MLKCLAVIPARGGSKRIPRKNIRYFCGRPVIAYPIQAALKSQLFAEVMVSTEDQEIADIALAQGASVPFMRRLESASDVAGTDQVVAEVLADYQNRGQTFDLVCCIYPVTPLLTPDILQASFAALRASQARALMPVIRYAHPVQRALLLDASGRCDFKAPRYSAVRTQDLTPHFYDAGQFYWAYTADFNTLMPAGQTLGFELSALQAQDIDVEDDWQMAELKYKMHGEMGRDAQSV